MMDLEQVKRLAVPAFFRYVQGIRYGYRDQSNKLHFADDEDFTVNGYAFSSPEDVAKNNCGWCWDVAELIKVYCGGHAIPCRSWFMEYYADELHQTHTQVFIRYNEKWCPAPDNSIGLSLGEPGFDDLEPCIQWFKNWFTDYLKTVLREKYDESHLLFKEYTCSFSSGISDEEYLTQIRK